MARTLLLLIVGSRRSMMRTLLLVVASRRMKMLLLVISSRMLRMLLLLLVVASRTTRSIRSRSEQTGRLPILSLLLLLLLFSLRLVLSNFLAGRLVSLFTLRLAFSSFVADRLVSLFFLLIMRLSSRSVLLFQPELLMLFRGPQVSFTLVGPIPWGSFSTWLVPFCRRAWLAFCRGGWGVGSAGDRLILFRGRGGLCLLIVSFLSRSLFFSPRLFFDSFLLVCFAFGISRVLLLAIDSFLGVRQVVCPSPLLLLLV
jgi:hypothetical protein